MNNKLLFTTKKVAGFLAAMVMLPQTAMAIEISGSTALIEGQTGHWTAGPEGAFNHRWYYREDGQFLWQIAPSQWEFLSMTAGGKSFLLKVEADVAGGGTESDTHYVNVTSTSNPPVTADIQGPTRMLPGQTNTWTTQTFTGATYKWERMNSSVGQWATVSTSPYYTGTMRYDEFTLRVTVSKNGESATDTQFILMEYSGGIRK